MEPANQLGRMGEQRRLVGGELQTCQGGRKWRKASRPRRQKHRPAGLAAGGGEVMEAVTKW